MILIDLKYFYIVYHFLQLYICVYTRLIDETVRPDALTRRVDETIQRDALMNRGISAAPCCGALEK